MAKLPEGEELERQVKKLGIGIEGEPITQSSMGRQERAPDHELQRRLIDAQRSIREHRLWVVALISAIASVASAIAAFAAVYFAQGRQ